jgi:S1-C subfamily serine protease
VDYRVPVQQGLLVYQVQAGGSAERAGIRGLSSDGTLGDIIISGDGQKLNQLDDLYRLLDRKQIGDTVNFEVYRGGKTITVPIKLLASPTSTGTTRRVQ